MILKKRVVLLLSTLLFLSGCSFKQTKENIVLQVAASDVVESKVKYNTQTQYTQTREVLDIELSETKINEIEYRNPSNSNGVSWLAAKVQDSQNARETVELIHTFNQFDEKISTIEVPGSKVYTPALPTVYEYGAMVQAGAVYSPNRVTRYGYDCGGCNVTADDYSKTASGIKVGADRVMQANGEWKQGYTYEGYHIIATSSAIPLNTIVKISNHPFSGGGISAGQPFYAIVGDRGVSGSNLDLFVGTQSNLNVVSQIGNPGASNTKVEIVK